MRASCFDSLPSFFVLNSHFWIKAFDYRRKIPTFALS